MIQFSIFKLFCFLNQVDMRFLKYSKEGKDSKIQRFKDSKIQRFKDSRIQGFKDSFSILNSPFSILHSYVLQHVFFLHLFAPITKQYIIFALK
jgi:hypothetical protein